jgi:hypothetical protein
MELSPSWEAVNCAVTQELPSIFGTRRLITVFTRALHWSILWARPIQSISSHPISLNIVYPPTSWSSQWSLSFWLSQQYPICVHLLPQSCYMPCPSHPPWLDHSNYTWRRVQVNEAPHHGMARPQVADGRDALQVWRVAAKLLTKQSRTADKRWSSSLEVGGGANNSSP